ncbi:MAG: superoxide dismutase family protein, partial [Erythrobacter sp.]|nr:superoxide dismutase family protein [Erythrobacter sp.]
MPNRNFRHFAAATLGAGALVGAGAAAPALADHHMKDDAPMSVRADVMTAEGEPAGRVMFEQTDHGVVIKARLMNLSPGEHGFHIHETGACSPDFKAAGGHYDPLRAKHGFDSEGGYHVGDLPNIIVEADGTAAADFFAPQLTLKSYENDRYPFTLDDADGSAVMVHA